MYWGEIGVATFLLGSLLLPIADLSLQNEINDGREGFGITGTTTKLSSEVDRRMETDHFYQRIKMPSGDLILEISPGFYRAELLNMNQTISFIQDLNNDTTVYEMSLPHKSCKITESSDTISEEMTTSYGYINATRHLGEYYEFSYGNANNLEDDIEDCLEELKLEVSRLLNITEELGNPSYW